MNIDIRILGKSTQMLHKVMLMLQKIKDEHLKILRDNCIMLKSIQIPSTSIKAYIKDPIDFLNGFDTEFLHEFYGVEDVNFTLYRFLENNVVQVMQFETNFLKELNV